MKTTSGFDVVFGAFVLGIAFFFYTATVLLAIRGEDATEAGQYALIATLFYLVNRD